jgi:eukaryotic-like serine/threonine-protein kinase
MSPETWPRIPVFGIDAASAMAYAAWWSARTNRSYRLPTEAEWEKAARGVDGRRYPWGDRFESIFCKMMSSRLGAPRPEPIGTFATDISPYGVRDMAGGIADWCTSTLADGTHDRGADRSADRGAELASRGIQLASRGGAWCDSENDCTVIARRRMLAEQRTFRLGLRLVRDA